MILKLLFHAGNENKYQHRFFNSRRLKMVNNILLYNCCWPETGSYNVETKQLSHGAYY